jgi:proteasome lid subunit RPN8/RPN11
MTTTTPFMTALITLTLPGREQPTQVTVRLQQADLVETSSGQKRLGDCTLAELAQYADQLEQEVIADYAHIRLSDLSQEGHMPVEMALMAEGQSATPIAVTTGLGYVVMAEAKTEAEPVAPHTPEPTPAPTELVAEEVPVEEIPTPEAMADDAAADSTEPTIHVAEPQSVFEEREAGITSVAVPVYRPDKTKVRIAGLRRPLNHSTWTAVDILVNEDAFRDSQAHALSSMDREVAGVLVGPPPEKQPDGRYVVHVTDTIIAKYTRMHGASVTYTPESWRYLNDQLHEKYPDESGVMVGWYHTHPGFGIFLSGMDLFIHQNFFTQIWHIALVLDPVARTSGFFCWDRQKTRVDRYDFPWPYWAHKAW